MTQYTCPNCRGGFDQLDNGGCPWCSTPMDGKYELNPVVSRVKTDDEDDSSGGLFETLFS